jgi:hypothetical protein
VLIDSVNRARLPAAQYPFDIGDELVALDGQRVIAPTEEKFYPAIESLRWRQQHLSTKY